MLYGKSCRPQIGGSEPSSAPNPRSDRAWRTHARMPQAVYRSHGGLAASPAQRQSFGAKPSPSHRASVRPLCPRRSGGHRVAWDVCHIAPCWATIIFGDSLERRSCTGPLRPSGTAALQCSAVQCSAVPRRAVPCSAQRFAGSGWRRAQRSLPRCATAFKPGAQPVRSRPDGRSRTHAAHVSYGSLRTARRTGEGARTLRFAVECAH